MKTTYIYFGTKGYFNTPGVTPSTGVADLATMTIANSGLLPASKATSVDPATLGYRVVHRAVDAVDDKRGTDYTTDFVTGIAFDDATAFDAAKNADDIQAGQVTNLTSAAAFTAGSANGVITVGDNTATGSVGSVAAGITMTTNDIVVVEQFARNDAPGNGASAGELSSAYAYPMYAFKGANPVAYAKTHYDGTALDQTDLHFLSTDGTGTDDIIRLYHTAGKYPDIVRTMEAIANCGVYNRAITFYDLDINGVETFAGGPSLSGSNDLGIVGCFRTTA